jgi:hypothetical protein
VRTAITLNDLGRCGTTIPGGPTEGHTDRDVVSRPCWCGMKGRA